jgi:YkoY family integral membrane protein
MFGQTFDPRDLVVIALLVALEGVLSIDNALVLGLLARRLPKRQQRRALTYGLAGAFVFRFIAIGAAAYLLQWRFVKLLGGGYLLWVAIKHFVSARRENNAATSSAVPVRPAGFWSTVTVIELTDIAFAIDSILAAIALVGSTPAGAAGPHPKLWVVITGGMLGVILMRFAAVLFIKLLDRFPRFETSAYLLVCVIGLKLVVDWGLNTPEHPHRVDFHAPGDPAFWIFWIVMLLCLAVGFLPKKKTLPEASEP